MSAELLSRAQAAGLLPGDATWPAHEQRPWPVVLLTALGAWLAALPLTAMLMMALGPALREGAGAFIVGALVLAASVGVLRREGLPLFVEQLAVPGLLVGGVSIAFGLPQSLEGRPAAALLLTVTLIVAVLLPRPWLRVLLGALAAGLAAFALMPPRFFGGADLRGSWPWATIYLLIAVWAASLWAQRRLLAGPHAPWAVLIEDLACGWLLQCLVSLCWLAGMTFLVGGVLGDAGGLVRTLAPQGPILPSAGSALVALAGAFIAQRAWPGLRQGWLLAVAFVLTGLAWLMPSLGGVLFALALLAISRRWRQAAAAGLAAAWVIGSFYYQLQWPLAQKALLLAGTGAALLLLVALAWRREAAPPVVLAKPGPAAAMLLAGVVLTLAVANGAIWQKEQLIKNGRPVFVALAPVDPRSLMQGDFMRLNFALPGAVIEPMGGARPKLVARLDARGVAQPLRLLIPGQPVAADELLLELTPKNGRWILVTDAWFFREGDAERFASAKFGEFRVLPDGRALLVGMADAQLQPLAP